MTSHSAVESVIRSPIWSCIGRMRAVPGGRGGGIPESGGWTCLGFWRFFSGRGLAIQSHAIVTQSISARWYAPRGRLRHGALIATDAESLVHLVLPWLPIPERQPRWTRKQYVSSSGPSFETGAYLSTRSRDCSRVQARETCNACDTLITKEQLGIEGILVGDGGRPPSSSRRLFPDLECGATHPLASMDCVESYCGSVVLAARGSRLR
jgi:hypothetical protein